MKSLKAKFASLRTRSSEQAHAAPVYETEELEQSPQSWDMGLAADEPVSCASREKLVVAHFMVRQKVTPMLEWLEGHTRPHDVRMSYRVCDGAL